ncbi:hypothetical protein AB0941_40025 [Streptomyces sp. NPDC013433]|uniref:hypothetical protein n=1 Tax=Streptomyces sp. NPDC013433 TaxID=3155604 RepID=UPI0034527ADA
MPGFPQSRSLKGTAAVRATAADLPGSDLILTPRDSGAQRMLLAGDTTTASAGAGSKRAKAGSRGIRLATPDEFADLIADYLG